jgi:hypothetical protein
MLAEFRNQKLVKGGEDEGSDSEPSEDNFDASELTKILPDFAVKMSASKISTKLQI